MGIADDSVVPPIPTVKSQVKKIADATKKGIASVGKVTQLIDDSVVPVKEIVDRIKKVITSAVPKSQLTQLMADDSVVPPIPAVKSQVKKIWHATKKGIASLVPKSKVTQLIADDSVVPPIP